MAKESLSSDLDLVKEVEQLRIKQRLLLGSLKDKEKLANQDEVLKSISSQLNFLVEIFKEVNSHDDEKSEEKISLENLYDEFKSFKLDLNARLENIELKIKDNFEKYSKKNVEITLDEKIDKSNLPSLDPIKNDLSTSNNISQKNEMLEIKDDSELKLPKIETEGSNLPPNPDFKVDTSEKKKGWFSK